VYFQEKPKVSEEEEFSNHIEEEKANDEGKKKFATETKIERKQQ